MSLTRLATSFGIQRTTNAFVTLATVPASTKWEVTEILATNIAATAKLLQVRVTRGGVSAYLSFDSIPATSCVRLERFTTLNAGDVIAITGPDTNLFVVVSGIAVNPV